MISTSGKTRPVAAPTRSRVAGFLIALSLLVAGCAAAPRCVTDAYVTVGSDDRHDLCEVSLRIESYEERPPAHHALGVLGRLPSSGPWGSGSQDAIFSLGVEDYEGPGATVGVAGISYPAHSGGLTGVTSGGPSWSGPCEVEIGAPGERLTFHCTVALEPSYTEEKGDEVPLGDSSAQPSRLEFTGDVPAPRDLP